VDDEQGKPGRVQLATERIARRELLRKSGRWTFSGAAGAWLLGLTRAGSANANDSAPIGAVILPPAPQHPSESPHCEAIGFGCNCIGSTCKRNGTDCPKRHSCANGTAYCWLQCVGGQNVWSCDWYCNWYACHCASVGGSC